MGLSGAKKRSKLSQDPNNTTWARSTANFGHKILSKQGWKPGDFLGAENATHSEHYSAANASHIRVMLREDNLGLGAQVGKGSAETFGLSMFSGLLGRLNGKSDGDVQKQQDALRDAELRTYTGLKYGFMNFVSGGLLVGDKIEEKSGETATADGGHTGSRKRRASVSVDETPAEASTKRNKLNGTHVGSQRSEVFATKEKKKRRKDKSTSRSKSSRGAAGEQDSSEPVSEEDRARASLGRKEKRKSVKKANDPGPSIDDDEKSRLKAEKRARKEDRRKRKEEKRRERGAQPGADTRAPVQAANTASESEGTATPPAPQAFSGRQAVRQRYIQQKRMASMDPQALKEIFMLQAKATA